MRYHLRQWLSAVPMRDPIEHRQALLLQNVLLAIIIISLLGIPLLIVPQRETFGRNLNIVAVFSLLAGSGVALAFLRRGNLALTATVAAASFLPSIALSLINQGVKSNPMSLVLFIPPVILVGLLTGRRTLIATIAASIAIIASLSLIEERGAGAISAAPGPRPWLTLSITFALVIGLVGLFLDHFSTTLRTALADSLARERDLERLRDAQDITIGERTAALETALAEIQARADNQAHLLAELEQQRSLTRELSVPVIPVRPTVLTMPLIGALDSARLRELQEQALHAIERTRARTLVLDITGVVVVDSQVAQGMIHVVQSARLLGTDVVLVGIRPDVAQTIVGLGLDLQGMRTFSDLLSALEELEHDRDAHRAPTLR